MDTGTHELTAGYALDALDSDERRRYEKHLPGCARCREELASFAETTAALAVAASGPEPRPELRERILGEARSERRTVVPFKRPNRLLVPGVAALAAAAAAVAIGLGIYSTSLSRDLDDTRSALSQLVDPDARTIALEGARGRLVVHSDGGAALVVAGLPERSGKTYMVWVVEAGKMRAAGRFDSASDATVVPLQEPVPGGSAVAVTLEDGPVEQPTVDPIVTSLPA